MTLILSLATHDYIVQVSDRRLTIDSGSQLGKLLDDDSNKATLFCSRMSFAYTGLADVDGKRTDKWIVDVLSKVKSASLSDACYELVSAATSSFAHIRNKKLKRQAFVGIGWTRSDPQEPFKPIICNITNALNHELDWLPEATDEFRLQCRTLEDEEPYLFTATGQRLPRNINRELERNFRNISKRGIGPLSIGRLLAEAIWKISDQNNAVGPRLLLVSLPKVAVEKPTGMVIAKIPDENTISFMYFSPENIEGVIHGPNYVCGGSAMTDFKAGPIRNGN